MLKDPSHSPSNDSTPTITASNSAAGYTVTLYTDSSCTSGNEVGNAVVAEGQTTTDITVNAISADGEVNYYSQSTHPILNDSPCATTAFSYTYDSTAPTVTIAGSDSDTLVISKSWSWSCSESCTYRFAINESQTHAFTSTDNYASTATATQSTGSDTKYYLHIQAKDQAGNVSSVVSQYAIINSTTPLAPVLSRKTPSSSPGNDSTPTFTASGVRAKYLVSLYNSSGCTGSAVGSATVAAGSSSVDMTASSIASDGAVFILCQGHARHITR